MWCIKETKSKHNLIISQTVFPVHPPSVQCLKIGFRVWYSTLDHHGDGGDDVEGGDGVGGAGGVRDGDGDGWRVEGGDRGVHGDGDADRGVDALSRCVWRLPRASSERQHQNDHDGPPIYK